eukprot:s148_g14.t1
MRGPAQSPPPCASRLGLTGEVCADLLVLLGVLRVVLLVLLGVLWVVLLVLLGPEQPEEQTGHGPGSLDPVIAQRIQTWLTENALPLLGVTGLESAAGEDAHERNQGEARPTGATSSTHIPGTTSLPVSSTSTRGNRKLEQARERGHFVRNAGIFLPEKNFSPRWCGFPPMAKPTTGRDVVT